MKKSIALLFIGSTLIFAACQVKPKTQEAGVNDTATMSTDTTTMATDATEKADSVGISTTTMTADSADN